VDVVVPGPTDIAGGDGAVRVEFGVAADHVHDRITHAVQLAAVDGIRAGGADLAGSDVGDDHVPGVDAGDGHARPTVDHQAGIAQVHVGADRHAGGVDVGITGGHAIDRYVVGQVEHQVGTVPVDLDIAVVVAEVDRAAGANVVVGHRAFAVHRYIPAGVGHVADLLELVLGRRLSAGVVVRIEGGVGQAADGAEVAVDHDRTARALHAHEARAHRRAAGGNGHRQAGVVDRRIADRDAAVRTQVDVLVELDLQGIGAIGNHADVAFGQRGLIGRTTHQVHRLAQPTLDVVARIARK